MADIYDQKYIEQKLNEIIYCKTCKQLLNYESQIWGWVLRRNGDRYWQRRSPHCKACRSKRATERILKKINSSDESKEKHAQKRRDQRKQYYKNPINRLKRRLKRKGKNKGSKKCAFRILCDFAYQTFKPFEPPNPMEDLLSTLKKEIQRRIRDESTPEIEIAAFYAAQGKPWANPRLSCAEAFRIRYKIDKEFREREKARSRTAKILETKEQKYMRKHIAHSRRVKRQKKQGDNTLNAERIKDLLNSRQNCLYCGKPLEDSQKAIDHMIPLAKGGEHSITNLAVSCNPCNNRKHSKDFFYWLQEIKPKHAERALNYYESQRKQTVQSVMAFNIF
jgi:5-methylcytosine-specific restriction endonuclease McrA